MSFLNGTDPGLRQTRTPNVDTFAAGVGFTAGSSTTVTLTADPSTENNLIVTFDGITQHRDTYSVSGTTVTFDAVISTGVSKIECTYTTTHGALTPADSSITSAKLADGAVTASKIPDGSVTTAKLASGFLTRDEHDKVIRAMMLEIADTRGAAIGFPEGNADAFDTDTLTATSTNSNYNAANDYYSTSPNLTLLNTTANAAAASSAYSFGLGGPWAGNYSTYVGNMVDADTSTGYHSANQGGTSDSWIVTLSTGGTATMLRSGSANGGAHASGGVSVYTNIVLYGSNDGSSWTTLHTVASDERAATAGAFIDWDFTNTTSYTRYRTDWSWGSAYYHQGPIQWAWYAGDGTSLNGTFVSPAYTATATPTKGYITVQAQFVSSSTLNTDLTAEISRDGGTTWTAVTLAAGPTQGSFTLYEGGVDISSQPAGASMKYRVKTLNSKTIYISGVVLRWS